MVAELAEQRAARHTTAASPVGCTHLQMQRHVEIVRVCMSTCDELRCRYLQQFRCSWRHLVELRVVEQRHGHVAKRSVLREEFEGQRQGTVTVRRGVSVSLVQSSCSAGCSSVPCSRVCVHCALTPIVRRDAIRLDSIRLDSTRLVTGSITPAGRAVELAGVEQQQQASDAIRFEAATRVDTRFVGSKQQRGKDKQTKKEKRKEKNG